MKSDMRCELAVFFLVIFFLLVPVAAFSAVDVGGSLKAGTACSMDNGDIFRNHIQADLDLQKALGTTEMRLVIRGEHDSIRPAGDEDSLRKYENGQSRFYIREGYVNHTVMFNSGIDSLNFKLGRIIHTWGVADEVKPVDIINPQDYSNLFYTLIQERKYGVLSAAASIYFTENIFLEMVAVPEFNPSEMGSEKFVSSRFQYIEAVDADQAVEKYNEESSIKNSSYAARVGFSFFDIDSHVNWFYGRDNLPTVETAADFSDPLNPEYNFSFHYKKIQMLGIDFQRALAAGIAVRGEAAWFYRGKYFALSSEGANPAATPLAVNLAGGGNGMAEKQYMEYTVGFDDHDFFLKNLYVNLQFNQRIIIGDSDGLADDRLRNIILFVVRYSFFNKKAMVGTRGFYYINDNSAMVNIEASYKAADAFTFSLGAWFIAGDSDTEVGQFNKNDIVYLAGALTF